MEEAKATRILSKEKRVKVRAPNHKLILKYDDMEIANDEDDVKRTK